MNLLSSSLTNNISSKLKIDSFYLKNEKNHIFNLSKIIFKLSELNKDSDLLQSFDYNDSANQKKKLRSNQDFVISYIITITFLKANTMIHVSDALGNIKWFSSSGLINILGKRKKKQRRVIILKLILLLLKKADFITNKPIALHFNNVNLSHQTFITNKLKKNNFIKIIKSFNQTPYNGCRQKKIRRKKYSKNFK